MKDVCKVAITGALGQIAYSLIFRIASGQMFGMDQKVILSLIDIPDGKKSADGLMMELHDCGFDLLESVSFSSNPYEGFEGADVAILIGAKPRGPGMERIDLLKANGAIFIDQGKALGQVASKQVKVVVVGNPCNTNALICMHHAQGIDPSQFSCLMMLDQNRARYQIAKKAGVAVSSVHNLIIWGNHSTTQVPDFEHGLIGDRLVSDVIEDGAWLKSVFCETVQKRGAAVIGARGKSSAASAASAIIDHVRAFSGKSAAAFSAGVHSKGNPYGIDENLVFSFPLLSSGAYLWSFVEGLTLTPYLQQQLKVTEQELIKEREMVKHLLG